MKLYHRTNAAEAILATGFRDGEGYYLTFSLQRASGCPNVPLDINEGAKGNQLLEIEIPIGRLKKRWESREKGKPYREFLIPARLVNLYGPPRIIDEE